MLCVLQSPDTDPKISRWPPRGQVGYLLLVKVADVPPCFDRGAYEA